MTIAASLRAISSCMLITACGIISGPTSTADPAMLIYAGDTAVITSPDTVDRGTSFTLRVRTIGGGCTHEVARTDVRSAGAVVEIRPYNLTNRQHGITCTADIYFLEHVATLRFAAAGVGVIRVFGVQYASSTSNQPSPAVLERRVVVR